ncbi:hypothetical protein FRC12_024646 [Ceratobasidium sp. 428]|nr:hypothetical protein FRC12_024646 [Ceratobasidium sp. 428]
MSPPQKRSVSNGAVGVLQSLDCATSAVRSRIRVENALQKHGKEVHVPIVTDPEIDVMLPPAAKLFFV